MKSSEISPMLPEYVKPIRAVKGRNSAKVVYYNIYDRYNIKIAVIVKDQSLGLRFGRWNKDLRGLSMDDFLDAIAKAETK